MMEERYEERRESKQVCRIVESSIEKKIFRFCVDVLLSIDLISMGILSALLCRSEFRLWSKSHWSNFSLLKWPQLCSTAYFRIWQPSTWTFDGKSVTPRENGGGLKVEWIEKRWSVSLQKIVFSFTLEVWFPVSWERSISCKLDERFLNPRLLKPKV